MKRFLIIIIAILGSYYIYNNYFLLRENYDTQDCLNKGYTKEFCLTRPDPGKCRCENGQIGKIMPGYGGECVCNYNLMQNEFAPIINYNNVHYEKMEDNYSNTIWPF